MLATMVPAWHRCLRSALRRLNGGQTGSAVVCIQTCCPRSGLTWWSRGPRLRTTACLTPAAHVWPTVDVWAAISSLSKRLSVLSKRIHPFRCIWSRDAACGDIMPSAALTSRGWLRRVRASVGNAHITTATLHVAMLVLISLVSSPNSRLGARSSGKLLHKVSICPDVTTPLHQIRFEICAGPGKDGRIAPGRRSQNVGSPSSTRIGGSRQPVHLWRCRRRSVLIGTTTSCRAAGSATACLILGLATCRVAGGTATLRV